VGKQRGKLGGGGKGGDAVKLGLEGRNAELVDGGRVHATGVLVADLLFVGATRVFVAGPAGCGRGGLLQNLPQVEAVEFMEFGKAAVGGLVRRQGIALEPAIATVAVEVVTGVDGFVDERRVEDAEFGCGDRGGLSVGHGGGENDSLKGDENETAA